MSRPEDDAFVTMMQVAMETPEMRQQLISVLSLPSQDRAQTIRDWMADLKQESAPELLISALSYLEDEQRADRALKILTAE